MRIACVHVSRFAIEVERQRRNDIAARLILIGDATVLDCSLGAKASGVRRGMRMSGAIGLCHRAVVLAPDLPYYCSRGCSFWYGLRPSMSDGRQQAGRTASCGSEHFASTNT